METREAMRNGEGGARGGGGGGGPAPPRPPPRPRAAGGGGGPDRRAVRVFLDRELVAEDRRADLDVVVELAHARAVDDALEAAAVLVELDRLGAPGLLAAHDQNEQVLRRVPVGDVRPAVVRPVAAGTEELVAVPRARAVERRLALVVDDRGVVAA